MIGDHFLPVAESQGSIMVNCDYIRVEGDLTVFVILIREVDNFYR